MRKIETEISLVDAVPRGGRPLVVEEGASAAVRRGEPEEADAPHRHLPRPLAEPGVAAVHYPALGLREHAGDAALCAERTVSKRRDCRASSHIRTTRSHGIAVRGTTNAGYA